MLVKVPVHSLYTVVEVVKVDNSAVDVSDPKEAFDKD